MALKEYKPGTTFPGRMGRTIGESDPAWPAPLRATTGGPNVLFIVLDDTGLGSSAATARRSTRPSARRSNALERDPGQPSRLDGNAM
jgi:arylsulfatase